MPGFDLALDQALLLELAQALREQPVGEAGHGLASSPKRSGRSVRAQTIAPVQRLPISSIAAWKCGQTPGGLLLVADTASTSIQLTERK